MIEKVVVTGMGCVSALGRDVSQFWSQLAAGRPAITELTGFPAGSLKVNVGAQIQDFNPAAHFASDLIPLLDRYSQLALLAAREAVDDAGLSGTLLRSAAAVVGTGCGGKETDEQTYHRLYQEGKKRAHPLTIPRGMPSAAASQVSMQLGIAGPVFSVSSACASANHAIAQAALLIRSGAVDVAVAGGTDAPFTYGLLKAWEAMRVLSCDTCRPFTAGRKGLVLGEGAGMVVLESMRHAEHRGAHAYAELAGCGMSSDAGHITDPSAEGAARAIRLALKDAGCGESAVSYVNAHGTGTQANDLVETRALRQVFGDHADRLAVSSTKSMHGHALGAAGGIEFVATVLALCNDLAPPTANFTEPGEGCDLDYVPNAAKPMRIDAALSNSFAFGGLNAVLLVRKV